MTEEEYLDFESERLQKQANNKETNKKESMHNSTLDPTETKIAWTNKAKLGGSRLKSQIRKQLKFE